jgi:hypothetical protein
MANLRDAHAHPLANVVIGQLVLGKKVDASPCMCLATSDQHGGHRHAVTTTARLPRKLVIYTTNNDDYGVVR